LQEVLQHFLEAGGTLIDSSPMYGKSESVIGALLKNTIEREKFFIATKVWTTGKKRGLEEMNSSLKNMGYKQIDLMQIHNLVDADTHIETLREWKAAGKIKYIGITHYSEKYLDELGDFLKKYRDIDFCQFPYSIGRRGAEKYFLDLCHDLKVATLINRPFEQDYLFNRIKRCPFPEWASDFGCKTWAQFFLKYIIGHKGSTCAIPATKNPQHMADNLRAGEGRLPDKLELKKMANHFDNL